MACTHTDKYLLNFCFKLGSQYVALTVLEPDWLDLRDFPASSFLVLGFGTTLDYGCNFVLVKIKGEQLGKKAKKGQTKSQDRGQARRPGEKARPKL